MNDQQRADLAMDTWLKCRVLLPTLLVKNLAPHSDDPKPLKKKGTLDIMRIRLLPIQMKPAKFWNSSWCFYEIAVGSLGGSFLCLGGVQFLQCSGQQSCGGGKWTGPVTTIIHDLHALRPNDFIKDFQADNSADRPLLSARYHAKPFKNFPVQRAAEDLAWLIQESLPRFEALK
jgi:hypothetical protein